MRMLGDSLAQGESSYVRDRTYKQHAMPSVHAEADSPLLAGREPGDGYQGGVHHACGLELRRLPWAGTPVAPQT